MLHLMEKYARYRGLKIECLLALMCTSLEISGCRLGFGNS